MPVRRPTRPEPAPDRDSVDAEHGGGHPRELAVHIATASSIPQVRAGTGWPVASRHAERGQRPRPLRSFVPATQRVPRCRGDDPALRQPVLAAQAIATVDVLSAGRAATRSPDEQAAQDLRPRELAQELSGSAETPGQVFAATGAQAWDSPVADTGLSLADGLLTPSCPAPALGQRAGNPPR